MTIKKHLKLIENTELPFYFENGFPENIKNSIIHYAKNKSNSLACQNESLFWAKLLYNLDKEIVIEFVGGFYYPYGNHDEPEGHSWLDINGFIFDPTAEQFDDYPNIDNDNYEITEIYDIKELEENDFEIP